MMVLITLIETIRYIAVLLQPFIPHAAAKILDQLMVAQDQRALSFLNQNYAICTIEITQAPTPIFKRIDYAC